MAEFDVLQREAATPVEGEGQPGAALAPAAGAVPPRKPYAQWALRIKYDPNEGYRESDFQTPVEKYALRFYPRTTIQPVNEDGKPQGDAMQPGIQAIIQEPVFEGKRQQRFVRWKTRTLRTMQETKDYVTSPEGRRKRFVEQFGIGSMFDADDIVFPSGVSPTQLIDKEFVPLLSGPFYKQLYLYDYLLMHARAFQLKNHNALAAAAVRILTRFVVGRGISYHIKDDTTRALWDEFWKRNNMREKVRQMAEDFTWQGELMVRLYEPRKGFTTVRLLDASTCWEVVTDPEDVEEIFYFHFQYPSPYQIWVSGNIPVSKYIVAQIPPTNILFRKMNISAQERRGRSDLLPAMPWLKRFDDFYDGQTVKALLEANLVWKIKVKGDQADVDAFMSNQNLIELPPPGGVWVENEAVDLDVVSASLTAGRGAQGIGQQIAGVFAASINLPNEYFNVEGGAGGARATALVRTDPAVKAIEDRQQRMREIYEELYERVIATAYMAGRLPKRAIKGDPELRPGEDDETPERPEDLLPSGAGLRPTQARLVRLR